MPAPAGYSRMQIRLHWIAGFVILAQFLLSGPIESAWSAFRRTGEGGGFDLAVALHVAGGAVIFALALWRLLLRVARGAPDAFADEPERMRKARAWSHAALYGLILALPVTGAAAWFGGLRVAAEFHEIFTNLLIGLVALHVAATAASRVFYGHDALARMLRPAA